MVSVVKAPTKQTAEATRRFITTKNYLALRKTKVNYMFRCQVGLYYYTTNTEVLQISFLER